jgi:nucleoside-diphosphate-sugar epimerase
VDESKVVRVGVTGGTGFLGGALVRRLLAQGVSVRVLARPSSRADALEVCGAEVIRCQLNDSEAIARGVKGTDLVYHVAAKVNTPGSKTEFFETNLGGTERVLTECLRQGVGRVIYTSSVAVYGLIRNGQPIDEDTPFDEEPELRDSYAQSKLRADEFAQSFARKTGLSLVVLRPGFIYGPGKPPPLGLLGFRIGKTNVVLGSRDHRLPLNYVENLIDAMQLAAGLKTAGLLQYNIVDDDNLTIGQYHKTRREVDKNLTVFFPRWPLLLGAPIAEALLDRLSLGAGIGSRMHQVKRALQDRCYLTRRIREETGWAPRVPLIEAIHRTLTPSG